MAGRLSSKVVIVTGGSTGIGRAVAGRVATAAGVAAYVAYLLSDEPAFITGGAGHRRRRHRLAPSVNQGP